MTETCTVVCSTSPDDIWFGSSGSLLPSIECKIVTIEGNEITGYDQPGELLVKSPAVVLGYLNNDKANKETFQDGYMRTGDEAVIRKGKNGHEHVFIVDRIKELIKVKVCNLLGLWHSRSLQHHRATRSHPPSSRHICSRTQLWLTALSSRFPTRSPVKYPRLSSSSRHQSASKKMIA